MLRLILSILNSGWYREKKYAKSCVFEITRVVGSLNSYVWQSEYGSLNTYVCMYVCMKIPPERFLLKNPRVKGSCQQLHGSDFFPATRTKQSIGKDQSELKNFNFDS